MTSRHFRKKNAHKILASQNRRERADAAPRLKAKVPSLNSLRLEIHETRDGAEILGSRRARPIVVEHAPAWFELPCVQPECEEGGHDVTSTVLGKLRAGQVKFDGSHVCGGHVGSDPCGRELHFAATAVYDAASAK